MNYVKIFHLAKEKGFEFETIWYEDTADTEFLQLCQIQQWLRNTHYLHVFIGYRPNKKTWDSHSYDLRLTGKEYVKQRPLSKFFEEQQYQSYDEALLFGVEDALNKL